jgi:hypothetical protein
MPTSMFSHLREVRKYACARDAHLGLRCGLLHGMLVCVLTCWKTSPVPMLRNTENGLGAREGANAYLS